MSAVPVARGTTLRQLAQQNNWNIDWDRLNSSGNDDGNAYRKEIFDLVSQKYNPYGSRGQGSLEFGENRSNVNDMSELGYSTVVNPYARFNGRDLSRQEQYAMMDRLGQTDDPTLRGLFARGRGAELFQGDRGMYNEYLADLGNMVYDDEWGFLPGEGGFQEGNRVGQSFRNMQMWGPAVVLGGGLLNNLLTGTGGLGAGLGEGAGTGGGFGGGGGGTAAGVGGAGGGGTGGLFGNAASGIRGGGSFFNQLMSSLGVSPSISSGINTARQGLGLINTLSSALGGGNPTGGSRPGGNTSGGGMGILDLLGLGASGYQDNRNIQQYESQINNLLDRGDPFRNQRQGYIDRLAQLYADPSSIENTPGYQFARDQGLEGIQRKAAARGMGLSGNEMGEMTRYASGLAAQTLDKERAALMQMAGANFNPADMAGRGIQAYGNIAQMQANRNAGVTSGLFGNNGGNGSGISQIFNLFKGLFPDSGGSGLSEEDFATIFGDEEDQWGDVFGWTH